MIVSRRDSPNATHTVVECAVRTDGGSPATEMIHALQEGTWTEDPEFIRPPSDDQLRAWAQMLAELEHLADYGYPSRRSAVNYLRDGMWEVKRAHYRLTYYDTPGDGTWTPKAWVRDRPMGDNDEFWWYPWMDEVLRVANGWPKTGQQAPPEGIAEACDIREEDTAHDR